MSISKKVLEHPVLTLCVFALIAIIAIFTLGKIKIALLPEVTFPQVAVQTVYENAGPESVEKSVTEVLESGLMSVNKLKKLTSKSYEGFSSITLEFNYGTNLDAAVNDIRDKLDTVKGRLPKDAKAPQIFRSSTSATPIMMIAVSGNRSSDEVRRIVNDTIIPRLKQTDGVAQASIVGGRDSIVRVELDQNRLDAYNLTLMQIANKISAANLEVGGGDVSEGKTKLMVRTTGEYSSVEQISDTVVGIMNGYEVRLSDVAEVSMSYSDEKNRVYINGKPGLYINVNKQSGANTVQVSDAVHEKIKELKATLPPDIDMHFLTDDAIDVRNTLNELIHSIIEGFLLSIIVLVVFLRNVRSTIIMGISIPFSIMITLLIMAIAGITLNLISMTGLILGVGMVVDASVVVLENIFSYRERGSQPKVAAAIGTQEVMTSVISGNLTTICVFIPFFLFKSDLDVIGEIFTNLMVVIIICLVASLFVAMFLVPILAGKFIIVQTKAEKPLTNPVLIFLDKKIEDVITGLTRLYRKGLHYVLQHRFSTLVIATSAMLASFVLFAKIPIMFMGEMAGTTVKLYVTTPLGTKLGDTYDVLNRLAKIAADEVKGYDSIVVAAGKDFEANIDATNKGSIDVTLPPVKDQIDRDKVVKQKLRKHFNEFPGVRFSFMADGLDQANGPAIKIIFTSKDLAASTVLANQYIDIIKSKVPEVTEPKIDMEDGLPQAEVHIDRDRASQFGLDVASIATEISASINGYKASVYRKNGNDYDIRLLFRDEDRESISNLDNIYVVGPKGRYPVSNFAHIERGFGPVTINRENQSRVVNLTASLAEGISAGDAEAHIKAATKGLIIPENITVSYDGSWKKTQKTGAVFGIILFLAIVLVFGVMAGTYESFLDPIINFFTMPFLIIGVALIHVITGSMFTMISMFGMVMLVGIVVNNGIILVDQTNLQVRRGMPLLEACEDAGASRLRPVLMTTLTTILGMVPLAFFSDPSVSYTQPIGLCIVGGLTTSTLVTLFVIPVIYSLVSKKKVVQLVKNPALEAALNGRAEASEGGDK